MKLIDKSAVVAEIARQKAQWRICKSSEAKYRREMLDDISSFLDTLEVKGGNFEDTKSIFDGQYISKDKVVTTIERLQDECEEKGDNNGVELLEMLFNKLDTLEVKEVDEQKERMSECPYRQVVCTMYEDKILECNGACSWVVDYPKLKELKAQKGE